MTQSTPQANTTGKAFVYGAEGNKTMAPMAHMQDRCFLCSVQIADNAPRQFWTGPAGAPSGTLMLAHTPCLEKFKAAGEVWPPPGVNDQAGTVTLPADQMPPPGPQGGAEVTKLRDAAQVTYGGAKLIYSPYHLRVVPTDAVAERGLKAIIPDFIVALQAIQSTLP